MLDLDESTERVIDLNSRFDEGGSASGVLLLTILVNMFVYSVRNLTRLYLDKKCGLHTEYKMWIWGSLITALSAWLGNTLGLAGDTVGGSSEHAGKVSYACNVVSFAAFAVFWTLNLLSPAVIYQMIVLLAISITFMQMLPFSFFGGKAVYRWKPRLWWVSFVPLTAVYVLIMLVAKQ